MTAVWLRSTLDSSDRCKFPSAHGSSGRCIFQICAWFHWSLYQSGLHSISVIAVSIRSALDSCVRWSLRSTLDFCDRCVIQVYCVFQVWCLILVRSCMFQACLWFQWCLYYSCQRLIPVCSCMFQACPWPFILVTAVSFRSGYPASPWFLRPLYVSGLPLIPVIVVLAIDTELYRGGDQ